MRTSYGGRGWCAALLAFFCLLLAAPALADPTFPPLTGRVVDDAHVLSPAVQQELTGELAALQAKTGDQLVVVTLSSLQGMEISDYGYQLGRAWGIGQKGKDNGALFIVAPGEKKVRVEVGYGLEPVLTDAMSSVILNSQVLPRFRAGDIEGGVVAGTDALIRQLGLDPAEAAAQAQAAQTEQAQPRPPVRHHEAIGTIFSILLFAFVASAFFRGGRRGGGAGWILPLMFMGGGFGGRDRDDDWGGGGGGGFSGGGGSFGGGGASGGW